MNITLATTCGGRLAHLRLTLPAMVEAAADAADVLDVEVIVVDFGPTAGVKAFTALFPGVRCVQVTAAAWNFGKARNAALNAATGHVFVNVDCDGFIDGESIERVADWMEGQGSKSYIRSPFIRGVHGRCAFFTDELRALGGWDEDDIEGAAHVMGADIQDVYDRARAAGFNWQSWPKAFEVIEHEIDRDQANAEGNVMRQRNAERRRERKRKPNRAERRRERKRARHG